MKIMIFLSAALTVSFSLTAMDDQVQSAKTIDLTRRSFQGRKYVIQKQKDEGQCPFCSFCCTGILRHIKSCTLVPTDSNWFVQVPTCYKHFSFIANWRLIASSPQDPRKQLSEYGCAYCNTILSSLREIGKHMVAHHQAFTSLIEKPKPITAVLISQENLKRPHELPIIQQDEQSPKRFKIEGPSAEQQPQIAESRKPVELQDYLPPQKPAILSFPFLINLEGIRIYLIALYNIETNRLNFECKFPGCTYCTAENSNIMDFVDHLFNHIDQELFVCSCNTCATDNVNEFAAHKRIAHHQKLTSEDFARFSNTCGQLIAQKDKAQAYSFAMGIACPCCKAYKFNTMASLKYHWQQCVWPNCGAIDIAKILFSHR